MRWPPVSSRTNITYADLFGFAKLGGSGSQLREVDEKDKQPSPRRGSKRRDDDEKDKQPSPSRGEPSVDSPKRTPSANRHDEHSDAERDHSTERDDK